MEKKTQITPMSKPKCIKCGGTCLKSKAAINKEVTAKDFEGEQHNGATISLTGGAVLVDCLKCQCCGHSFVPEKTHITEADLQDLGFTKTQAAIHETWWTGHRLRVRHGERHIKILMLGCSCNLYETHLYTREQMEAFLVGIGVR